MNDAIEAIGEAIVLLGASVKDPRECTAVANHLQAAQTAVVELARAIVAEDAARAELDKATTERARFIAIDVLERAHVRRLAALSLVGYGA